MNNFETELSNIDKRVKAYNNSRLADIKNALKKKFEEACARREQSIKDLNTILNRHDREDFAFSIQEADDEASYEIHRMDDGLHVKIDGDWMMCNGYDPRLPDAVDSLDSAEDMYEYLTRIDMNNQRIDRVLKAYLKCESLRANRMKDRFEKLLRKC